ncbi:MAG: AAA family ATPase, partial [Verrucomicrobiae bacterium]|nr:AAA family ATPase [Verrucomicrobiae bacterium]
MTKADMQWHEDDYVAGNPGLAGSAAMVVLSGCSGSGKSTLLAELGRRGMPVQPEAGRQIVKEQLLIGGHALPWDDAARFVELAASRAAWQFNSVRPGDKPVVFDRSVVDVVAFLDYKGLETPAHLRRMLEVYRYHRTVLMTPP